MLFALAEGVNLEIVSLEGQLGICFPKGGGHVGFFILGCGVQIVFFPYGVQCFFLSVLPEWG